MVLERISSDEALGRLRSEGRRVRWPDHREPEQRMAGLVSVSTRPSFEINPTDQIFTMGSCFARNIERRLVEIGFEIPLRQWVVDQTLEYYGHQPDYLNKYNTGAMRAEIGWAAGDISPTEEEIFVETPSGDAFDLFMTGVTRIKNSVEHLRILRKLVAENSKKIRDCRIIVITLGMAEAWFDTKTGLHINQAPPAAAARAQPDRFVLEVMSYEEILRDLDAIHSILRQRGHPDFKMIVTVSPVPLLMTYRAMDVITANSYSKSVLRAAAEAFVCRHDNVDYFPSYEPITMTDRRISYGADNRHVQSAVVSRVVDRFMTLYAPAIQFEETQEELTSSGVLSIADLLIAAKMRVSAKKYAEAADMFEKIFSKEIPDDPALRSHRISIPAMRLLYAGSLIKTARPQEAIMQVELIISEPGLDQGVLVRCTDLFISGKAHDRASYALDLAERTGGVTDETKGRRQKLDLAVSEKPDA